MADDIERVAALVEVVRRLRAPDGCPWDREQTPASLRATMLEEAYEVLEAIDEKSMTKLREELGDVLLQVLMQSVIAEEAGEFTLGEVADTVREKLVRRHPHVFGARGGSGPGSSARVGVGRGPGFRGSGSKLGNPESPGVRARVRARRRAAVAPSAAVGLVITTPRVECRIQLARRRGCPRQDPRGAGGTAPGIDRRGTGGGVRRPPVHHGQRRPQAGHQPGGRAPGYDRAVRGAFSHDGTGGSRRRTGAQGPPDRGIGSVLGGRQAQRMTPKRVDGLAKPGGRPYNLSVFGLA